MNRAERDAVRESISFMSPRMHVEIPVAKLRALLDECDRLEDARVRAAALALGPLEVCE